MVSAYNLHPIPYPSKPSRHRKQSSHVSSLYFLDVNILTSIFIGNASPYSTGLPGASLTSTTVEPTTQSAVLLWDEEEMMFDDISNPLKGKGKERDVGKRRAYVRVVTNIGGGSLNLELYCEKVYLLDQSHVIC